MNTKLRLIAIASLLMATATGCNNGNHLSQNEGGKWVEERVSVATLSDEKLTDEEISAIKKGATLPGESNNAIIYDQQKMLLTYQGTSSCPDHPESVTTENSTLKIKFTNPAPEKMCAAVMTGPFTKVIDLPMNFSRKENIKVYTVMGGNETEIPVVVN